MEWEEDISTTDSQNTFLFSQDQFPLLLGLTFVSELNIFSSHFSK